MAGQAVSVLNSATATAKDVVEAIEFVGGCAGRAISAAQASHVAEETRAATELLGEAVVVQALKAWDRKCPTQWGKGAAANAPTVRIIVARLCDGGVLARGEDGLAVAEAARGPLAAHGVPALQDASPGTAEAAWKAICSVYEQMAGKTFITQVPVSATATPATATSATAAAAGPAAGAGGVAGASSRDCADHSPAGSGAGAGRDSGTVSDSAASAAKAAAARAAAAAAVAAAVRSFHDAKARAASKRGQAPGRR
jgi:hypothetical protein